MRRPFVLVALVACSAHKPAAPVKQAAVAPAATSKPEPPPTAPPPAPPATPLSPAEAQQIVADAARALAGAQPDCATLVPRLSRALPVAKTPIDQPHAAFFAAYAACLQREQHFLALLRLGGDYTKANLTPPHPEWVERALIGQGHEDEVARRIDDEVKRFPGDAALAAVRAHLECDAGKWSACEADARASASQAPPPDAAEAWYDVSRALMHQGKLDDAEAALAKVTQADAAHPVEDQRGRIAFARQTAMILDAQVQKEIALGVYHLYSPKADGFVGAPVSLRLFDLSHEGHTLEVSATIAGLTETTTQTVVLPKDGAVSMRLVPPISLSFDLHSIRSNAPANLDLTVALTDGGTAKEVMKESYPVTLLPYDVVPTRRRIGADAVRTTWELLSAWVTPNARPIDEILTAAKARLTRSFDGEQGPTVPQVKALFEELKARGVSYVMDPDVVDALGTAQRIRLPSEIFASTNAQCVEGSVAFASLMEAIGLKPVLVSVTGHMFVGWHAGPKDGVPPGTIFYLETTAVHPSTFEKAMELATRRVELEEKEHHFDQHVAQRIDIAEMRARGLTPQPKE